MGEFEVSLEDLFASGKSVLEVPPLLSSFSCSLANYS
jgi:hypothetical protein